MPLVRVVDELQRQIESEGGLRPGLTDGYHNYFRKRLIGYLLEKDCAKHSELPFNRNLQEAIEDLDWKETFDVMVHYEMVPHTLNCHNDTCVHVAFDKKNLHVVRKLLGKYTILLKNFQNDCGITFLHIACAANVEKLVDQIITDWPSHLDRKVETGEYAGYTPLHFAVENDNSQIASFLLMKGASIKNQRESDASTPVHIALYRGNFGMVSELLNYDVDLHNTANGFGLTHFMAACVSGSLIHLKNIINSATNGGNLMGMVNARVSEDDPTFPKFTPLHFAALTGNTDIASVLIDSGASPSALNEMSQTPAGLAVVNGHRFFGNFVDAERIFFQR